MVTVSFGVTTKGVMGYHSSHAVANNRHMSIESTSFVGSQEVLVHLICSVHRAIHGILKVWVARCEQRNGSDGDVCHVGKVCRARGDVKGVRTETGEDSQGIRADGRTSDLADGDVAHHGRIVLSHDRFEGSPECGDIGFLCSDVQCDIQDTSPVQDQDEH